MAYQQLSSLPSSGQKKRTFLQSLAGLTVGSFAFTQSALAETAKADEEDRTDFVDRIRESEQYAAIEDMVVEGGFLPEWGEATVFNVDADDGVSDKTGIAALVPTENVMEDEANVVLVAFEPDNGSELELKAKATHDGIPVGTLYTDGDVVRSSEGFNSTFPLPEDNSVPELEAIDGAEYETGQIPSFFPSVPSWITDPLPGFDDIRDMIDGVISSGRDIIENGANRFQEFGEWVADEGIDHAWEFSENVIDVADTVLDPIGPEPSEDLKEAMSNEGMEYVATIDLRNTCHLLGTMAIGASAAVTITGIGAPAGAVLFVAGSTISFSCAIWSMVSDYRDDMGGCDKRYAYAFVDDDFYENYPEVDEPITEAWTITVPCE